MIFLISSKYSLVKQKVIFGIDSYFKGINIAFISGKQLYKYAEGLENNLHQLKRSRGSLSVQYQLKTSFTHSMLGANTCQRWEGRTFRQGFLLLYSSSSGFGKKCGFVCWGMLRQQW